MNNEPVDPDQIYKSDDIELISFLLARESRIKDVVLRNDRRVDFFVVGPAVFTLVKDYDAHSRNTLVSVHEYTSAMKHVRDAISRVKKAPKGV